MDHDASYRQANGGESPSLGVNPSGGHPRPDDTTPVGLRRELGLVLPVPGLPNLLCRPQIASPLDSLYYTNSYYI